MAQAPVLPGAERWLCLRRCFGRAQIQTAARTDKAGYEAVSAWRQLLKKCDRKQPNMINRRQADEVRASEPDFLTCGKRHCWNQADCECNGEVAPTNLWTLHQSR